MPLIILLPFNLVGGGDGMIIKELNLHLIYQLVKDYFHQCFYSEKINLFFFNYSDRICIFH
jgi:hypothetical protein